MPQADIEELDEILPVVAKFYERTHEVEPDLDVLRSVLSQCIDTGIAVITKTPKGVTGLFLGHVLYNAILDQTEAHELMWWSSGNTGGFLLQCAEVRARDLGADRMYMSLINTAPAHAHEVMRVRGFVPIETNYKKELV